MKKGLVFGEDEELFTERAVSAFFFRHYVSSGQPFFFPIPTTPKLSFFRQLPRGKQLVGISGTASTGERRASLATWTYTLLPFFGVRSVQRRRVQIDPPKNGSLSPSRPNDGRWPKGERPRALAIPETAGEVGRQRKKEINLLRDGCRWER